MPIKNSPRSKSSALGSVRPGSDFSSTVMDGESDIVPDSDQSNFDTIIPDIT